jgi:hypothetical protein
LTEDWSDYKHCTEADGEAVAEVDGEAVADVIADAIADAGAKTETDVECRSWDEIEILMKVKTFYASNWIVCNKYSFRTVLTPFSESAYFPIGMKLRLFFRFQDNKKKNTKIFMNSGISEVFNKTWFLIISEFRNFRTFQ